MMTRNEGEMRRKYDLIRESLQKQDPKKKSLRNKVRATLKWSQELAKNALKAAPKCSKGHPEIE